MIWILNRYLCTFLLLFPMTLCVDQHGNIKTGKLMVCYYTPTSNVPVSQVPADLCTHICYAFGKITTEGIQPLSSSDFQKYKSLVQLKQKNPNLKILLSLQTGFPSVITANTSILKSLSQSSVKFLSTYGFDGVDLDWEFPAATDKDRYKTFIEILHNETTRANMIMSAALPNSPSKFKGYDVDCLIRNLDFMTAMTYDFHFFQMKGDNKTGYNSPLFTPKGENENMSTSAVMMFYLKMGIPASKLLMGVPLYGRSWTLANSSQHGLHAPAVGKGGPGPYRHFMGVYEYPDVCVALQNGAINVQDDTLGAAYLYLHTTWVAYEGTHTVDLKLSWMKSQKLGGVGVWAMHLDDNAGVCKSGFFPLLTAIKSGL